MTSLWDGYRQERKLWIGIMQIGDGMTVVQETQWQTEEWWQLTEKISRRRRAGNRFVDVMPWGVLESNQPTLSEIQAQQYFPDQNSLPGFLLYQSEVVLDLRWDFRLPIKTILFPPHERALRLKGLKVNGVWRKDWVPLQDATLAADPSHGLYCVGEMMMMTYCSLQELYLHRNGWRRTAVSLQRGHHYKVLPGLHFRSRSMHIKKGVRVWGEGGQTRSGVCEMGWWIGNNRAKVPSLKMYKGALDAWNLIVLGGGGCSFSFFSLCTDEKGGGEGRQSLRRRAGCQARYCSIVLNILITLRVKEPCGACSGVRVKNEQRHHAWAGGGCLPTPSAGLQCLPAIETLFQQGGGLVACFSFWCVYIRLFAFK